MIPLIFAAKVIQKSELFVIFALEMINQATFDFIRQHADADVRQLALRGTKNPEVDLTFALEQIAGRQKARTKLPSWAAIDEIVYPPHLSMEQCSSETTALYKARLAGQGETYVDLTGGFGVDFYFMSQAFSKRIYVEQNADLCTIVEHNMQALGLASEVVCKTTAEFLASMPHADVVFLDPARRNEHGGRTYSIEDCSPNVLELMPQLMEKADKVILKLSPMLDWHQAVEALKHVSEVHIVSVNNECKELLLVLSRQKKETLRLVCVNGENIFEIIPTVGTSSSQAGNKQFPRWELSLSQGQTLCLYEPNASIMKSGCFAALEERFPVQQISPNSHLFISTDDISDFPGRSFLIQAVSSMNKRELKEALKGIDKANITVRNFPLSVAELRKRLKLKEGGDVYIFATTVADDGHQLFVCRKKS